MISSGFTVPFTTIRLIATIATFKVKKKKSIYMSIMCAMLTVLTHLSGC